MTNVDPYGDGVINTFLTENEEVKVWAYATWFRWWVVYPSGIVGTAGVIFAGPLAISFVMSFLAGDLVAVLSALLLAALALGPPALILVAAVKYSTRRYVVAVTDSRMIVVRTRVGWKALGSTKVLNHWTWPLGDLRNVTLKRSSDDISVRINSSGVRLRLDMHGEYGARVADLLGCSKKNSN